MNKKLLLQAVLPFSGFFTAPPPAEDRPPLLFAARGSRAHARRRLGQRSAAGAAALPHTGGSQRSAGRLRPPTPGTGMRPNRPGQGRRDPAPASCPVAPAAGRTERRHRGRPRTGALPRDALPCPALPSPERTCPPLRAAPPPAPKPLRDAASLPETLPSPLRLPRKRFRPPAATAPPLPPPRPPPRAAARRVPAGPGGAGRGAMAAAPCRVRAPRQPLPAPAVPHPRLWGNSSHQSRCTSVKE